MIDFNPYAFQFLLQTERNLVRSGFLDSPIISILHFASWNKERFCTWSRTLLAQ